MRPLPLVAPRHADLNSHNNTDVNSHNRTNIENSGNKIINIIFGGGRGCEGAPMTGGCGGIGDLLSGRGRGCCGGSELAEFGDSKLGSKLGDAQKDQTMWNGIIGVLATVLGGPLGALMGGGMMNQNQGNSQVLEGLVGNPFNMLA